MRRFVLVAVAAFACATPQRANLAHLQYRAVFDLACPAQSLALYHIDERTKAVMGCGKQLVYVERCDQGAGNTCSWELDSPSLAQGQWPQPAPATSPPPQPAVTASAPQPRTIPTELFGTSREAVPARTTPAPSDGQPF